MLLLALALLAADAQPETLVVPFREVVVSGNRMREPLARVPAAITVVNRSTYSDTRGNSLKDALSRVPGVFVQSRAGAQDVRVTIRGFGARGNGERSNAGNTRGILFLTDGIPVTDPDGRTQLDLIDLGAADHVEVSRSNASALYGNASGGVVNLRTNLEFDTPYFEARSRGGSFGYHREQGMAGFAPGTTRGTASILNSTFDGWRKHSSSSATQMQFRLGTPLASGTRLGLLLDASSTLARYPGPLTRAQADSAPEQANPRFVTRDERRKNQIGRFALTLDRDWQDTQSLSATLFVEHKVLQRSERNRFRDFNRYHLGGSALFQRSFPIQPGLMARLGGGIDQALQDGSILFYTLAPDGSRGEDRVADQREAAHSTGGFFQGDLVLDDRWSARFALRYDRLRYISEDHIEPSLDDAKNFTRWTPKAGFSYFTGEHTIFAALGGGVEAPAFNEIDPPAPFDTLTSLNPFLDAMHSTTYELGARGRLVRLGPFGQVRYDAALYWIDVRNDLVPFDGGTYFFTAGQSRRKGAELGLGFTPVERLLVEGAMTVSENKYVEYRNELGDFHGNRIAGLPSATGAASARYTTLSGVSAELGVESARGYYAEDANAVRVDGYTILHATLGYTRGLGAAGSVRLFGRVENLSDVDYTSSVFINGTNGEYFEPGLPRNWSAGVTLRGL